jgi:glutamate synthase domain-containing protein 2
LPGELLKECIAKERKRNIGVDQKSQAQFSDHLDYSTRHGAVLQARSLGPFRFIG